MAIHNISTRAKIALQHLKQIKPYDGWSYDTYHNTNNKLLIVLRRRNVPLTSSGFDDIVLDSNTGSVIGLLPLNNINNDIQENKRKAVVLVEKDGKVCGNTKRVIEVDDAMMHRNNPSLDRYGSIPEFTDEQNKMLLQFGGAVVIMSIFLNTFVDILRALLISLSILCIPIFVV